MIEAIDSSRCDHRGRLADLLFSHLPFPLALIELPGTVLRTNRAAQDVLERLGFEPTGYEGVHQLAELTRSLGLPVPPSLVEGSRTVRLPGPEGQYDYDLHPLPLDDDHLLVALVPRATSAQALDGANMVASVVRHSRDFIVWCKADHAAQVLNPTAAAMVGGAAVPDVPVADLFDHLFDEESRDRIANVGCPTMEKEGSWRDRVRVRNRDTGEVRHLDWMMFAVRDASGRSIGMSGTGRDVTEELHNAAAALPRQMLEAQEAERRRIAADVHDDSAQALTVVSLRLQRLGRRLEGENLALLEDAIDATTSALGRLRRLIFDLHPTALDQHGIASALADFVSLGFDGLVTETTETMQTAIEGDDDVALEAATRSAVYRATREAMLNAARHSQATRLTVRLTPAEDGLLIVVADNGKGFDPASMVVRLGHLGLTGARAQIVAAGGRIGIASSPTTGTTVTIWVPGIHRSQPPSETAV